MAEKDFVKLKNVTKIYQMGEVQIRAVDGIDFSIDKGEFVVVVGPSGAGKTTVLNILGGMDKASGGEVLVDGKDIAGYSQKQLTGYRRNDIGFVFQFYNLVPNLTALENVDLHIGFGHIVGLLGPNGSGKTTLIKLANGLLQPSAGSIRIAGMTPGPDTKAIVSYLPDADWLPDWMRVEQLVEMFHEFYADFDPAKANEMLARLELEPKARLKTLSKGSKEKVQLILAMSRAAKLYLLDEPIGGVDPAARDYILSTILNNYSRDATVILSTHLIGDIEPILDEAVFLKDGRVFAHRNAEELRETEGMSVDAYFREVFEC